MGGRSAESGCVHTRISATLVRTAVGRRYRRIERRSRFFEVGTAVDGNAATRAYEPIHSYEAHPESRRWRQYYWVQ